jgi:hypothetical protein
MALQGRPMSWQFLKVKRFQKFGDLKVIDYSAKISIPANNSSSAFIILLKLDLPCDIDCGR